MKIAAISLAASALAMGLGLSALAFAEPAPAPRAAEHPVIVEGKDHPILLGRMVVTAEPLD